jgi:hypothetical protein
MLLCYKKTRLEQRRTNSMGKSLQIILPALLLMLALFSLYGCGCGFDCNSNGSNNNSGSTALLTLGLSDSLPEDLKEVWIEVDAITFKRSGADDVVVNDFTITGGVKTGTFRVNLLNYPGTEQLKVIQGLELEPGTYNVSITIIADGTSSSSVKDANDNVKALTLSSGTVSGGTLTVSGMQLASGNQTFTVEFGLAQALQFLSASDTYLLAANGLRIENNLTDATLSGALDSGLFNTVVPCNAKTTPTSGNRVYLYKGTQAAAALVDVFTSASTAKPPNTAVAPFAVASLIQSTSGAWSYAFGYVPPGDYTLAFSCNTATDDSIEWNNLTIPLPVTQRYEITLARTQKATCNLTSAANCE